MRIQYKKLSDKDYKQISSYIQRALELLEDNNLGNSNAYYSLERAQVDLDE